MSDPLELGSQMVGSHPTWVLGSENGSSANREYTYAPSHLSKTVNF